MAINLADYRVKNAPTTVFYIPNFISQEEEAALLSKVYGVPRTKWTVLSHRRLQNWGGLPGPKGMVAEDLPQWLSSYGKKISDIGAFEGKVPNHVLVNEYEAGQGIMPHEDGPAFYPTVSTISLGSHTLLDFYHPLSAQSGSESSNTGSTAEGVSCDKDAAATSSANRSQNQGVQGDEKCAGQLGFPGGGLTSYDSRYFLSLLLEPRSLVLLQDDMYKVYLHGIKEVVRDTVTQAVANLDSVPQVRVGDVLDRKTRVSLTIRYVPKVIKSKLIFGKR